jgi:hypothetical protein
MKKTKNFDLDLSENERKTIASLIEIKNAVPRPVKKTLSEICKETKITNKSEKNHKGENTHRGYQHRILKKLKEKGIVEKDENKKYFINSIFLNLASSSLIQNKIKNLEKTEIFTFSYSTVFGIKNNWLEYPEMYHFHESLVNALNSLYMIKMVKKIFLLRDFSVKWKSFLDSDVPLAIKYEVWIKIRSRLSIFDQRNENEFLEKQIDVLKSMGMPKEKIEERKKEINKQHKDFIIKFREKIGYEPKKYKIKKFEKDDVVLEGIINKKLNKKQKKQVDNVLDWCLEVDNEEIRFRHIEDEYDFSRIESILKNIEKNTIDDSLTELIIVLNERNRSRFSDRFTDLFIKLIKRPFILAFYKQIDKKTKEEIISILREDIPYSKNKTDYQLFYDYAIASF